MYVFAKDYLLRDLKKGELGIYYKEELMSGDLLIENLIYELPCHGCDTRYPHTDQEKKIIKKIHG